MRYSPPWARPRLSRLFSVVQPAFLRSEPRRHTGADGELALRAVEFPSSLSDPGSASQGPRVVCSALPLTQGGRGLSGALRSMTGPHPEQPSLAPGAVPSPSPAAAHEGAASAATTAELFECAARQHSRRLLVIARAVVGNRASPEDVVQQALVNLYQHRDRYDWHQPGGLLRRAVVNEALRILRQPAMTSVTIELPGRTTAAIGGMIDGETVERVRAAIDRLPEHFRAALVLCEYEGMAYAQIAEVLGASVPQVKTWLHRGRRQLAEMLKDYALAEPERRPPTRRR